jgi:soluble lytic murein transglycosylase
MAITRDLSEGDIYSTLAGYNAGPYGESIAWRELAGGDPDLFLEIVRSAETRKYIRDIYEIYNIYRTLYGPL